MVSVNHVDRIKLVSTKKVNAVEGDILQLADINIHYRNICRQIIQSGDGSWKAKCYLKSEKY